MKTTLPTKDYFLLRIPHHGLQYSETSDRGLTEMMTTLPTKDYLLLYHTTASNTVKPLIEDSLEMGTTFPTKDYLLLYYTTASNTVKPLIEDSLKWGQPSQQSSIPHHGLQYSETSDRGRTEMMTTLPTKDYLLLYYTM